jgi:hypothetical protein
MEMIVFDVKQADGKTTIDGTCISGWSGGHILAQAKDKFDPEFASYYRFTSTVTFAKWRYRRDASVRESSCQAYQDRGPSSRAVTRRSLGL